MKFVDFLASPTAPELGPGPRPGVWPLRALQSAIDEGLAELSLPPARAKAARALVLLWHDHHDPAHKLVQDLHTADASYVHAILHRREPDFGNAKYWLHRTGEHPCHEPLAKVAANVLKNPEHAALRSRLLRGGKWDASAFVDACEAVAGDEESKASEALREIQAAEFLVLLEFLTT